MGNILALGTFQGLAAGVEQKKAKIKKSIKNRHLPHKITREITQTMSNIEKRRKTHWEVF